MANPSIERNLGLVPFPYYCFAKPALNFVRIRENARSVMQQVISLNLEASSVPITRGEVCARLSFASLVFTNVIGGGKADVQALRDFLAEDEWRCADGTGFNEHVYFSVGLNCPGAHCHDFDAFMSGRMGHADALPQLPYQRALAVLQSTDTSTGHVRASASFVPLPWATFLEAISTIGIRAAIAKVT